MSFSSDVKNEVARLEGEDQETERAELFGLLRISGSVSLSGKKVGLHFATENAALARRVLRLLKNNFAVQTEVIVTRSTRLKKNNRYQVHVVPSEEAREALGKLHLLAPISEAGAAEKKCGPALLPARRIPCRRFRQQADQRLPFGIDQR